MHSVRKTPIAAAIGAALALTAVTPAHAALIRYSVAGTVSSQFNLTGYTGQAYTGSLIIDTTTDLIDEFSFSVAGKGTWSGSGGTIYLTQNSPTSNFRIDLTTGTFDTIADGFTPTSGASFFFLQGAIGSPLGDFLDGYPLTVNAASYFCVKSVNYAASSPSFRSFGLNSFTVVGEEYTPAPAPATAALTLAGLGALAAVRRRKAARKA